MYSLFSPAPAVWPQNSTVPGNAQYIFTYPTPTYVVNPLAFSNVVPNTAYSSVCSNQQPTTLPLQHSESESAPSVQGPVRGSTSSTSSDEVFFFPNESISSVADLSSVSAFQTSFLQLPSTGRNAKVTHRYAHQIGIVPNGNDDVFPPFTPGIRIPEKYNKNVQEKQSTSFRNKYQNSSCYTSEVGSLNSSGNTSGSRHDMSSSGQSSTSQNTGPEIYSNDGANTSTSRGGNTSSGTDVSPPNALLHRRFRERRSGRSVELSSVSSSILPMSLRAAINEDPPEPKPAVTPLKTSSPKRNCYKTSKLSSNPPGINREIRERILQPTQQLPIGAELSVFKKNGVTTKVKSKRRKATAPTVVMTSTQTQTSISEEGADDIENVDPTSVNRLGKRRGGRYITGAAALMPATSSSRDGRGRNEQSDGSVRRLHSVEKYQRVEDVTVSSMSTTTTAGIESVDRLMHVKDGDGDREAEMDQCRLILRQQAEIDMADEQARKREEFLLILEAERERQRRLVLPKKAPKMMCKFCRNNGESEEIYTKHRLHDKERTACPILRHYVCRLCNSTGDFAHTIRHCPFNNRKDRIAWKATFLV